MSQQKSYKELKDIQEKAIELCKKAETTRENDQYKIADLYYSANLEYHKVTNKGFIPALKGMLEIANAGNRSAIKALGICYDFGLGVKQDKALAQSLFKINSKDETGNYIFDKEDVNRAFGEFKNWIAGDIRRCIMGDAERKNEAASNKDANHNSAHDISLNPSGESSYWQNKALQGVGVVAAAGVAYKMYQRFK